MVEKARGTHTDENDNIHNTRAIVRRNAGSRCIGLNTDLVNIPVVVEYVMILVIRVFALMTKLGLQERQICSQQYPLIQVVRRMRK